ncbi:hypothetical protein [Frankia sp. AgPm24]|uniref:hypothetical protein n=1 Tax=Frankia sp. AgPm24 TaxID=631128 RepID=UPI00200D11BD|nr:hypothetical protein [Frankia sp. AgPm24]
MNNSAHDLRVQLREAERRIGEHPGYQEHARYTTLARTLNNVFIPNWDELTTLLDRPTKDFLLAMELVQNVSPSDIQEKYSAEIVQRLHNYVAGTMTLVDHARRAMRNRTGDIAGEFERRRSQISSHLEIAFVQDLRNFTLHRALPLIGHKLTITGINTPGQQTVSAIELSTNDLSRWDRWTPKAREFIQNAGDEIALGPLIERHGKLVVDINSWLYESLRDANKLALAEVDDLIVKRNAILFGSSVEDARTKTQKITERRRPSNR